MLQMENSYTPPVDRIRLQRGEDGVLLMHLDGQRTELNPPKRALPLTDPDNFIVLYDSEGEELFMLDSVAELDSESRVVLAEALEQAYRIEHITRILEVDKDPLSGQTCWRVEIAVGNTEISHVERAENKKAGAANGHTKGVGLLGRDGNDGTANDSDVQEREFFVNGQEDVQTARYPHIFIVDTERNRYEIVNCDELDPASRRAAEVFF